LIISLEALITSLAIKLEKSLEDKSMSRSLELASVLTSASQAYEKVKQNV